MYSLIESVALPSKFKSLSSSLLTLTKLAKKSLRPPFLAVSVQYLAKYSRLTRSASNNGSFPQIIAQGLGCSILSQICSTVNPI